MRYGGLAFVMTAMVCFGAEVQAQSGESFDLPAEFPPTSYAGRQYVDSRGCMYVRAGIDGQVTWIPRVTRDRRVICGQQPTLQLATTTTAAVSDPTPAADVVELTAPKPAPKRKPKAKAKAKPRVVAQAPVSKVSTQKSSTNAIRSSEINPHTLVAPRHVYEQQRTASQGLYVPKGYQPIWTDDRLNPRRTHQTLAGKAKMDEIWTKTVPRRLRAVEADR
ncbi:MAG: hypothetical protein AAF429_15850 [Pseudomonadota bacterium]